MPAPRRLPSGGTDDNDDELFMFYENKTINYALTSMPIVVAFVCESY